MNDPYDLIIVGAGPCGIAVGAAAEKTGLSCILFDRGAVTSSLLGYPHYMTFFSTADLLEVGGVPFTVPDDKPTRRQALAYYRHVVKQWGLDVHQYEGVEGVSGEDGNFTVRTLRRDGTEGRYRARAVVVATGYFQKPNRLDVPGEDLDKVHHHYHEPYPYFDQDVVVVGAGNSAVEAALELYRNHVRVSLVHFLDSIDRGVKPWVVPDIRNRLDKGQIPAYWRHRVSRITPTTAVLRREDTGAETEVANDFVLALTGWRSNHEPLKTLGVGIDGETGVPSHDPATMQTNVQGIYIAGVIAAGHNANRIFIENGRDHGDLIVAHRLARSGV